jgi:hypothetical protein
MSITFLVPTFGWSPFPMSLHAGQRLRKSRQRSVRVFFRRGVLEVLDVPPETQVLGLYECAILRRMSSDLLGYLPFTSLQRCVW